MHSSLQFAHLKAQKRMEGGRRGRDELHDDGACNVCVFMQLCVFVCMDGFLSVMCLCVCVYVFVGVCMCV